MKPHRFLLLSLALFCFAARVASQRGKVSAAKNQDNQSVYAELDNVPEKHRAKANPFADDPQAAAAGSLLFEEHCQECHGRSGAGTKKAPSLRAPEVQQAAPGAIFWILSNGVVRRGMPVWSRLPEPQRWQLVSYIKSLGAEQ